MKKKIVSAATLILASSFVLHNALAKPDTSSANDQKEAVILAKQAPGLSPQVIEYALNGFNYAKAHGEVHRDILTIVDFSQSSNAKRMYVFDLDTHQLLMNIRVAHGMNSGMSMATHFSNSPESRESSLGVYTTANTYYGHHGNSLRIKGLEKGINSNAFTRDIVVHSAWYMTPDFVKQHDRTGRSFGCFAVAPSQLGKYMSLTKNGSVIFAYAAAEKNDPIVNGEVS